MLPRIKILINDVTRFDATGNDYDDLAGMEGVAAAYWYKAYCKIIWEYFPR